MKTNASFSKEKIKAMASDGMIVSAMASELNVNEDELAAFYASCYKEDKSSFPIRLLVTKTWLAEKLISEPIDRIARESGCSPTLIKNLIGTYGLEKKQSLSKQLTPEVLYTLYVEDRLSDREIARKYNCSYEYLRKLRKRYHISYDQRRDPFHDISIEYFHKLHVGYGFKLNQIAKLLGCTQYQARQLRQKFANADHPLADEIKEQVRDYSFIDLIDKLLDAVEPAVLYELLKDHTLAQAAEMYGVIPPAEPGVETFSSDWLAIMLRKMQVPQIIKTYHLGKTFVRDMMKENRLTRVPVLERLDENVVRTLFIDNHWDDKQIAEALNTSVSSVVLFRSQKGIKRSHRQKLLARLDAERFVHLYMEEGLTLPQIAELFDAPASTVSSLKKKYAALEPAIAAHRSHGVTPEKLAFLKKQLKFENMSKA